MELTKSIFHFDHCQESLYDAVGLSKELDEHCVEIIFFSAFSNYLLGRELFEDEDDIPRQLTTVTGDLEKCLKFVKNDHEKDYLLLIFKRYHQMAVESVAKYSALKTLTGVEKKKLMVVLQTLEIKLEESDQECITPTSLFKRIKCVVDSRYNFDKYLELLRTTDDSWVNSFMNA